MESSVKDMSDIQETIRHLMTLGIGERLRIEKDELTGKNVWLSDVGCCDDRRSDGLLSSNMITSRELMKALVSHVDSDRSDVSECEQILVLPETRRGSKAESNEDNTKCCFRENGSFIADKLKSAMTLADGLNVSLAFRKQDMLVNLDPDRRHILLEINYLCERFLQCSKGKQDTASRMTYVERALTAKCERDNCMYRTFYPHVKTPGPLVLPSHIIDGIGTCLYSRDKLTANSLCVIVASFEHLLKTMESCSVKPLCVCCLLHRQMDNAFTRRWDVGDRGFYYHVWDFGLLDIETLPNHVCAGQPVMGHLMMDISCTSSVLNTIPFGQQFLVTKNNNLSASPLPFIVRVLDSGNVKGVDK